MAVRWSDFETREPELAASSRRLLHPIVPAGPGLCFLATTRADGGPRVHPVCPALFDGGLYVFVMPRSPERADLEPVPHTVWLNPRQPGTKPVYHRWRP